MTHEEVKERLVQIGKQSTIYAARNKIRDPEQLRNVVLAASIECGLIVMQEGTVRFEGNTLRIDGWRWATKKAS